jgi:predicted molibdopterin-dependent oxidoreductase YjgC
VTFTFDGREVQAEAGQSVAAALLAAGIRSWRTTRLEGTPRGLFCGIGVCFDCLVDVNGQPGVRACLTEVHEGDRILTQQGAGHADLTF